MGLSLKRTVATGEAPVFQKIIRLVQGGFALDTTGLPVGGIIPEGAVIVYDEATRKAKVVKTAEVVEAVAVDGTAVKVKKGHLFSVGDFVYSEQDGDGATISAIDTSNADYDTITISAALGVMEVGAGLVESIATGVDSGDYPAGPKGLNYNETKVEANTNVTVLIDGTVYARRIPVTPDFLRSALPPMVVFSESM